MSKFHRLRKLKIGVGIFAIMVSIIFGVWLILLMLGYPLDFPIFGMNFSLANYIRALAEIVVASLLVAALAFL